MPESSVKESVEKIRNRDPLVKHLNLRRARSGWSFVGHLDAYLILPALIGDPINQG